MHDSFYVYILASRRRSLYVGVTNDLRRRLAEHRERVDPRCFTARYNVFRLVHYEHTHDVRCAIAREKEIKRWVRWKKVRLIERSNPTWRDLSADFDRGGGGAGAESGAGRDGGDG
jgi:putative endonuclease